MRILIIFSIFLFSLQSSKSQWQSANGPYTLGSDINSITSNNSYLFAGTNTLGVLRVGLGGSQWTTSNNGISGLHVYSINSYPDGIYACTYNGLSKSTNNGDSWNDFPLPGNIEPISMIRTNTALMVGSYALGIVTTTNNGVWWDHQFAYGNVRGFAAFQISRVGTVFAATSMGLMKSTNNYTWTQILPIKTYCVTIIGDNVFAGGMGVIYRSTDAGITWTISIITSTAYIVNSVAEFNGNIYAGADDGIYISSDNGLSWPKISDPITNVSTKSIYALTNKLFAGTFQEGFLTTAGSQWSFFNSGLPVLPISDLNTSGGYALAVGGGIFSEPDMGNIWQKVIPYSVGSLKKNSGKLYANFGQTLMRSTNNGFNWSEFGSNIYDVYCVSGNMLFRAFEDPTDNNQNEKEKNSPPMPVVRIDKSLDFGQTWTRVGNIYGMLNVTGLYVHERSTGNSIYGAPFVWSSTDDGANWYNVSQGLTSAANGFIFQNDSEYVFSPTGIFFHYTASWGPINGNLSDLNIHAGTANNYGIFIAGAYGIYRSTNHGLSWVSIGFPGGHYAVSLAADNEYLFAGTDNDGVWKYPLGSQVGIGNGNNIPKEFALNQNYPNPFNPSTKITYELQTTGNVHLVIFDVTGREIAVLVDQKQNAGRYEITFEGDNLPSGIYFYKIETGNWTASKKMILLK